MTVKPSYGLSDTDIARMLEESHTHASEDMTARALAEARVEADSILAATENALAVDADLLATDERAAIESAVERVRMVVTGNDHRAISAAIEALNRASENFAARRMDRSVAQALTGRSIDALND